MTQTHEAQAIFNRAGRFAEPAHSCGARALLELHNDRSTRARAQWEGARSRARRTACSWMSFVTARSAPARPPSGALRRLLRPRGVKSSATTFEAARGHQAHAAAGDERCPQRRVDVRARHPAASAFPARQGEPRRDLALAEVANGCLRAAQPRVGAVGPAQRPPGRSENATGERQAGHCPTTTGPVLELRRVLKG